MPFMMFKWRKRPKLTVKCGLLKLVVFSTNHFLLQNKIPECLNYLIKISCFSLRWRFRQFPKKLATVAPPAVTADSFKLIGYLYWQIDFGFRKNASVMFKCWSLGLVFCVSGVNACVLVGYLALAPLTLRTRDAAAFGGRPKWVRITGPRKVLTCNFHHTMQTAMLGFCCSVWSNLNLNLKSQPRLVSFSWRRHV